MFHNYFELYVFTSIFGRMSKISRKIGLEGLKFNAPIGYFAEERIFKNNFMMDVSVCFLQEEHPETEDISKTIDYTLLYAICAKAFAKEALLIETVAQQILDQIKRDFPFVDEINICIKKLNPPVKAEIQHSFITLNYQK